MNKMKTPCCVVALGLIALLSPVLLGVSPAVAKKSCTVTMFTTDEQGNPDMTSGRQVPCKAGETNGGIEYYNPFHNTYTFNQNAPIVDPRTGANVHGTTDNSTPVVNRDPIPSSNCRSAGKRGKKKGVNVKATTSGSATCNNGVQ